MEQTERHSRYEICYPRPLREAEDRLVAARHGGVLPAHRMGVALSGGGIRSATFCLGVFQTLARQRLLKRIDYLSTVSGGGYFGSFLGRLFSRDFVKTVEDVEGILAPAESPTRLGEWNPRRIVGWLRENGRYLAPQGSGDVLLMGATLARNWVALQLVISTLLLTIFLSIQVGHLALDAAGARWWRQYHAFLITVPLLTRTIWWSPLLAVPLVPFLLAAVPSGWSYWLVARRRFDRLIVAVVPVGIATVACYVAITVWLGVRTMTLSNALLLAAGVVALLTLLCWATTIIVGHRRALAQRAEWSAMTPQDHPEGELPDLEVVRQDFARNLLTRMTRDALLWTGGLITLFLIDSFSQTIYAKLASPAWDIGGTVTAIVSAFALLSTFARQIAVSLGSGPNGRRLPIPAAIGAWIGAVVIVGSALVLLNTLSHAIAWRFDQAVEAPLSIRVRDETRAIGEQLEGAATRAAEGIQARSPDGTVVAVVTGVPARNVSVKPCGAAVVGEEMPCAPARTAITDHLMWIGGWFFAALVLSVLLGLSRRFVNMSSYHGMYQARLARAYLGASNVRRMKDEASVAEVTFGDDLPEDDYWQRLSAEKQEKLFAKAAPLHLINVTLNETMGGRSQVEQRDRKGLALALGPSGLSVGAKTHAIFYRQSVDGIAGVFAQPLPTDGFQLFDVQAPWRPERMSTGRWIAISGAAFSTGTGYRTSIPLSLLAGFGNIRLGYWWDSNINRKRVRGLFRRGIVEYSLSRVFKTQSFLFDELLARFRGPGRGDWYLSDGGHFENLGGYELLRRRPRVIISIDAEADPDYTFDGLGNLVRSPHRFRCGDQIVA
jgi:hypothetical protein